MLFTFAFMVTAIFVSWMLVFVVGALFWREYNKGQELQTENARLKNELLRAEGRVDVHMRSLARAMEERDRLAMRRRVWHVGEPVPPGQLEARWGHGPGYVYLLEDIEITRLVKIGRAVSPRRRMRDFGVKLPFRARVLACIQSDDCVALETELHRQYADKRVRGEWFALSPADVEEIRAAYPD